MTAISELDIDTWLSDTTTANVSTTKHGFVPKAPNDTTKYLRGDGSWAVPPTTPGTGGTLPYMYPFGSAIDDPINDNFRLGNGSGGMDTSGTRFSGASAWTGRNLTGATVAVGDGQLWLTSPATTTLQLRGYDVAVPSGNWCIRMTAFLRVAGVDTTQKSVGLYIHDSVGGKFEFWSIGYVTNNVVLWAGQMTDVDSFSGNRVIISGLGAFHPTFLEIEYNGTNYYFRTGWVDGPLWRTSTLTTFAKTNFLANAADRIGVMSQNNASVATTLITTGFYRVPTSSVL